MNYPGRSLPHHRSFQGLAGLLSWRAGFVFLCLSAFPAGYGAGSRVLNGSATFETKDLKITGISSKGFSYAPGRADAEGLAPFHVRGDPNLVASMPSQGLTITCSKLNGRIHVKTGALASAELIGGVTADSELPSKGGLSPSNQSIHLESASTNYKNLAWKGPASGSLASAFEFPHALLISGKSNSPETTYSIHGASGRVTLKSTGSASGETLDSASVTGSVTIQFSRQSGKEGVTGAVTSLAATAESASIQRVNDATTGMYHYVIRLTGGVNVSSNAPTGVTKLQDLSGIEITLNQSFEVTGWQSLDDGTTGTFQPTSLQSAHHLVLQVTGRSSKGGIQT